jgi:DedD protein
MSETLQTPETVQFKKRARRRLMGAIVIVSILVILLPMVLDKTPEPVDPGVDISIPSQEESGFRALPNPPQAAQQEIPAPQPVQPEITPIPPQAVEPPAELPEPAILTRKPVEKPIPKPSRPKTEVTRAPAAPPPAQVEKSAAVAPKTEPKAEPKPKPQPPVAEKANPEPEPVREGYAVQVASFSNVKNAEDMKERIAALGLRTYTDNVGGAWRVRVGPFPSVELADAARGRLILGGHDGVVVSAK